MVDVLSSCPKVSFTQHVGTILKESIIWMNIWYLGRELEITTSEYSLPTIAKEDQDWFSTLQEMMNWNVRARQKKIQTKNKTDEKW